METYDVVKRIFDHNIIYCLFPMIMTLIIFRKVLKKKVDFPEIFNWIRWFIIGYTVITTIVYLAGMTIDPEKYAFYNRATGPYAWAYWVILIGSLVFPLSLIYKPLGINPWYLLLVSILMKIGFYMERYTIILVSIHRDYLPSNW